MKPTADVKELLTGLRSKDGFKRELAREELVRIGKPAVTPLVELMKSKNQQLRWEACKALGSLEEPGASPALVEALRDGSAEIRWLAAEGLIALGTKAIVPILQALQTQFDSILIREGAHHILHALERKRKLDPKTQAVLNSMRSLSPELPIALAAHKALKSLRAG